VLVPIRPWPRSLRVASFGTSVFLSDLTTVFFLIDGRCISHPSPADPRTRSEAR
jgi:hypothetical protein